jgi:hypothetical protein
MGGLKWAPLCHIFDSLHLPSSTMCLPLCNILAHLIPISSLPPVIAYHVPLSLSRPLPPVSCPRSSTCRISGSLSPSPSASLHHLVSHPPFLLHLMLPPQHPRQTLIHVRHLGPPPHSSPAKQKTTKGRLPCHVDAELTGPHLISRKQLLRWLVVVGHHLHHKWKAQKRTKRRGRLSVHPDRICV